MLSKERLREINFFTTLSDNEIEIIGGVLTEAFYKKGQVIWEEGAPEQGLHIIDYGSVRVTRKTREGHRQVLAVIKAGGFYGELSMLDGRSHSASAEALEDTKVFILTRSNMDKLLKESPLIAFNILKILTIKMSEILRQMNNKFIDMVSYVWE